MRKKSDSSSEGSSEKHLNESTLTIEKICNNLFPTKLGEGVLLSQEFTKKGYDTFPRNSLKQRVSVISSSPI
jgi:hypothetical protein